MMKRASHQASNQWGRGACPSRTPGYCWPKEDGFRFDPELRLDLGALRVLHGLGIYDDVFVLSDEGRYHHLDTVVEDGWFE